jgi:hypothetical protein
MIRHIVMYKFVDKKEGIVEKTKEVLYSMKGIVPEVIDIEAGGDFLGSERSFDFVLVVTLKGKEALASYQKNDYHVGVVKKYMHSIMKESHSVDYEI